MRFVSQTRKANIHGAAVMSCVQGPFAEVCQMGYLREFFTWHTQLVNDVRVHVIAVYIPPDNRVIGTEVLM